MAPSLPPSWELAKGVRFARVPMPAQCDRIRPARRCFPRGYRGVISAAMASSSRRDARFERGDAILQSPQPPSSARGSPRGPASATARARAAQEVRPASLPRAGRARQLDDERAGRPRREFREVGLQRRDVGEAVQALGVDPELARRLRSAQHQRRDERGRLGRHAEHARQVVRVAHHAAARRLDHQRERAQLVERGLHVGVGHFHERRAAGLLVAAQRRAR